MPDMEQIYKILADYERRLRYLEAIDPGSGGSGLTDHDHTAVAGDGGVLTGDEHDLWSEYLEIVKPGAPAANKIRFYAADLATVTRLFTTDSAGLQTLLAGGGVGDVDTVDTIHAAAAATANYLVALDAAGEFPADVVGFDALALPAMVWVDVWYNTTAVTFTDDDILFDDDTQTHDVTLRRKSDVVVIGNISWNQTTARTNNWEMRWDLDGTPGTVTNNIGNTASTVMYHAVLGRWSGVAAGARTLMLQCRKTQVAQQADDVTVYARNVIILIIPVD